MGYYILADGATGSHPFHVQCYDWHSFPQYSEAFGILVLVPHGSIAFMTHVGLISVFLFGCMGHFFAVAKLDCYSSYIGNVGLNCTSIGHCLLLQFHQLFNFLCYWAGVESFKGARRLSMF